MQNSKFPTTLDTPLLDNFYQDQPKSLQPSELVPTSQNLQNANLVERIKEQENSEQLRNKVNNYEQINAIDECEQNKAEQIDENNRQNKIETNDQKVLESQVQAKKSCDQQDKNKVIKCQNKICNSIQNIKKIKSKIRDKFLYFCRRCCERYVNNAYCYYCEQIYLSQYQCDGLQWIQCENCQRWNHTECQKQNTTSKSHTKNQNYLCIDCEKKSKRKRYTIDSYQLYEYEKNKKKMNAKYKQHISTTQKVKIFRQKKQTTYAYLDSFLTAFSYKLALTQDQINKDLYSIRQNNEMENLMKAKNENTSSSARKKKR